MTRFEGIKTPPLTDPVTGSVSSDYMTRFEGIKTGGGGNDVGVCVLSLIT